MRRLQPALLFALFLLLPGIIASLHTAAAVEINGVSLDSDSISINPSQPTAGDTVSIFVEVENSNQQAADIDLQFYKNSVQPSNELTIEHMVLSASDGVNSTISNVTVFWPDISVSDTGVYVRIIDSDTGDSSTPQFKSFSVTGLPNLNITAVDVTPSPSIHQGDDIVFDITLENTGSENATSSQLSLVVEGTSISLVADVPAIVAGTSSTVTLGGNSTSIAPQTGIWSMLISVDINAEVEEIDEQDNTWIGSISIVDRPDLYLDDGISVSVAEGGSASVSGPWTITGTMVSNFNASGLVIPLRMTLSDGTSGASIELNRSITWGDDGYSHMWSLTIAVEDIPEFTFGSHLVSIAIDTDGVIDSNVNTADDVASSLFSYVEPPNVSVAILNADDVADAGSVISWTVEVHNTGDVAVSGTLVATWMDTEYAFDRVLSAGQPDAIRVDVDAGNEERNYTFSVQWNPDEGWMDSNQDDNSDSKVIDIDVPFMLNFDLYSLFVTPDQPYIVDRDHVLAVNVNATDSGTETITCVDENGVLLHSENVTFNETIRQITYECPFNTNTTGQYSLSLSFVSGSGQNYTTSLQIDPSAAMLNIDAGGSSQLLWLLIPFTLILIGAFVAAVVMTRKPKEEANVHYIDIEDDGFDPDSLEILAGETVLWTNYDEENAHTVSSKTMVEGKLLFNSGDLTDHEEFVYTFTESGTYEYGCKHSEEHVATIRVYSPEDENLDEIITGAADFADDVNEMGFGEDDLEDHWDDEIVKAEAEVEAVRAKEEAELLEEDITAPIADDSDVVMRVADEDAALTSEREGARSRDLDKLLSGRGELKSLKDEDVELTASDAEMRADLYALTGEDGVMPGDDVRVGIGTAHLEGSAGFVGNELHDAEADFSFDEEDVTPVKRRERPKPVEEQGADCGGCGANVPLDAKSCHVCGARFE